MSLISADALAERLVDEAADAPTTGAGATVVCDVRFYLTDPDQGRREYQAGHIPGAVFIDLHTQLAGGEGGGRHPLPAASRFADLLGEFGITPATFVVAYDSTGGATASRLWWMLRSIGHGQVAVLDGGLPAWLASGHQLSTEPARPNATHYPPVSDWTGIVSAADVAEGLSYGATVIDSRAGERFRGEVEPIDRRAGHIPGAINRFHLDNLTDGGTHRPVAELVAHFAGVGESPIVYCGSGVTACHNLLALSLAGVTRARLYPGSWSEWSSDPSRPIATGPES
jgi:thiosulfate/3-mercaptopyruvate sulfurtransferase